jgi:hypothetical protein
MHIIFLEHPDFMNSISMPRFAGFLKEGMETKGHKVEILKPESIFHKLPAPGMLKKWLGYIDQFILFPILFKVRLKEFKGKCLFVLTDHALGPWVPLVADQPHVIHCHDFLAQLSAKGGIRKIKRNGQEGFINSTLEKVIRKVSTLFRFQIKPEWTFISF